MTTRVLMLGIQACSQGAPCEQIGLRALLEVVCDGQAVLTAAVERGRARRILKSSDGHAVANLAHRQVELRHRGTTFARTVLEPD